MQVQWIQGKPYAFLRNGELSLVFMGGDGEGDDTGESDNSGDDSSEESEEETSDDSSQEGTVSLAEYEKLKGRMKAADRSATADRLKLKEYEDAAKSDLEKATDQVAQFEKVAIDQENRLKDLLIENAFLRADEARSLHNPVTALRLIERDSLEFDDETGRVTNMKDVMKELRKEQPFLFRSEDDGDEGDGNTGSSDSGKIPTKKKQGKDSTDRAALEKKYPALRGRTSS